MIFCKLFKSKNKKEIELMPSFPGGTFVYPLSWYENWRKDLLKQGWTKKELKQGWRFVKEKNKC